jgi:4'-phosphopantetheinyl transferase
MDPEQGVCIYYTRTEPLAANRALCLRYRQLLSAEERRRHRRFLFDRDRHIFLVAHALTRTVLGRWTGLPPEALQFETGEHGKPAIAAGAPGAEWSFNLSHTRGLVACAVTRAGEVGVDVERIDPGRDLQGVARRVFSKEEYRDWESRSGEDRCLRFFHYWTLKEAYIKAQGGGLGQPLRSIRFTIQSAGRADVSSPDPPPEGKRWQLTTCRPVPGHLLSVALCAPGQAEFALEEMVP